ncbi:cysteine peptidase family C39 domain-containing protein [Candidatus Poriferisodalis sp.]|uniref:cysteine peptidase family C39 domain-containing protein n=1 Tax=Candidatus Poriferisodalis sp. TaxID=3101277 RepID=UPI003B5B0D61
MPTLLRRRSIRTPLIPQLEAAECGAASLAAVMAHFGRWVPLEELRDDCGVGRDGASAAGIVRAGNKHGMEVRGWRKEVDSLAETDLPAILYWEFNHFLVLEGIVGDRYHLNDPANGRRRVSRSTVERAYAGVVLTASPTASFRPVGERPSAWRALWPWLAGTRGALAYVALAGLLLAIPALALPVLLGVFVDSVLGGEAPRWGGFVVAAMALAGAAVYLLTWLQQRMLRRIAIGVAVVRSQRLLQHLLRLPKQYFAHRFAGDLTTRVGLVDEIADGAGRHLVGLAVELATSVALWALLVAYDPLIAASVLAVALVNVAIARLVSLRRADHQRLLRREQALLFGIETTGLRQADMLRATAAENDFFVRWSGHQARELSARQRVVELAYVNAALPGLFLACGTLAVLGLGGWRVIEGDLSIGELIAVYVLAGSFLAPIGRFVLYADTFELLGADVQRVRDISAAEPDPAVAGDAAGGAGDGSQPGRVMTLNGRLRLAGRVEVSELRFGYRGRTEPLIDGLSLAIEPGQRVAVVGPTGSGKSTLLRLVSGEFEPWSGEVLFDGVSAREIPRPVFVGSVATVDQQIALFDGSVRDNITMWNAAASEADMVAAARDAMIHDDIMRRRGGYEAHVREGGANFSGGQRQRLEIARALVARPSVLLLDEATSTLDAETERRIDDALRRRGCSCLIVAHRLSTIRDCDQIIVMDGGREVQRGSHDVLLADADGLYSQLVRSQ